TDVTTYKYHYAGGAITEIELDKVRDSTTTLLDQELIYHIGANSQPISFEWTRHTGTGESQTTTTSTYYYHYDIHGNTLKVTDTNQDTKITYTYDTLGNITSQTNPDSIPNPFTFMGASQTILDTETGLYFSSGYYNPQTGTLLQGTGSPAMPNPTSISTINSMSTSSLPEEQLLSHSITSATTAGSSSGGEPGSFAPPSGPSDGISHSGRQSGPPSLDSMSIGGISISYSGGGNSWVNKSIFDQGLDFSRNQDLPPESNGGETSKEYEERKKFMEDLRDGQIVSDEGSMHKVSEMPILLPMKGIASMVDMTLLNDEVADEEKAKEIAEDYNPNDDGEQYDWVIRDSEGSIVACRLKGESGVAYVFKVDSNGVRTSKAELASSSELKGMWNSICDSVSKGLSSVGIYDSIGRSTTGTISMNMGNGEFRGIFVQPGKNPEVRTGKDVDFGIPSGCSENDLELFIVLYDYALAENENDPSSIGYRKVWRLGSNLRYSDNYGNHLSGGVDLTEGSLYRLPDGFRFKKDKDGLWYWDLTGL
ncbi:MAG: RHS repeat protein, partial [Caldisericales bacterium]|nr:RHS repeat protein [Caldisericales bacterium]